MQMVTLFSVDVLKNLPLLVTLIFLFIVLSYYALFFINPKKPKQKELFSSISIIIPAHNEEDYIKDAIDSAIAAEFNGKKQIIVVDDGSRDRTSEIIAQYARKGVKIIRTLHSGKSASLNKALAAARGDLIAIIDGDSIIHRTALKEMAKELSRDNVAGACGVIKVRNRHKLICMWSHIEQIYNSMMRLLFTKINANVTTPGPLSVYRRKALMEVGGFSAEGYSEDMDITIRLIRNGYRISFAEKAVAETNMPYKIKEFLRQRSRFAGGMLNILKRHMKLNKTSIDFYTFPILLFTYIQAVIMGIFTIYQIVSGYIVYFASKGIYFSPHVLKFFFEWFSIIGFVRWFLSVIMGSAPVSFITIIGILSTFLTYPLYFLAILKFDRKIDFYHIVPVFFMFPFWLLIMIIYIAHIPEYFNKRQYNIWKKNE